MAPSGRPGHVGRYFRGILSKVRPEFHPGFSGRRGRFIDCCQVLSEPAAGRLSDELAGHLGEAPPQVTSFDRIGADFQRPAIGDGGFFRTAGST